MSTTSPTFQDEAHFVTVPIVPNQEKIEFQVTYQNNLINLTPQ